MSGPDWELRRRNLRAIIAVKERNASEVAVAAGLAVNTLRKFLRGDTSKIRADTLERICSELGLANSLVLDAENPFSTTKNELYELIDGMTDDQAAEELDRLRAKLSSEG